MLLRPGIYEIDLQVGPVILELFERYDRGEGLRAPTRWFNGRLGGEAAAVLGTLAAPLGRLVTVLASIDPIVIGVIPTAPNRGLWCSLGAWLH